MLDEDEKVGKKVDKGVSGTGGSCGGCWGAASHFLQYSEVFKRQGLGSGGGAKPGILVTCKLKYIVKY